MYQFIKTPFVCVPAIFLSAAIAHAQQEETQTELGYSCDNTAQAEERSITDMLSATVMLMPVYEATNPVNTTGKKSLGIGAGIVLDTDRGTIVTNHHVIEHSDAIYFKFFNPNGVNHESNGIISADIIGFDEETDIAVLHAQLPNMVGCIGTQDAIEDVEYLDDVYAIGHPMKSKFYC